MFDYKLEKFDEHQEMGTTIPSLRYPQNHDLPVRRPAVIDELQHARPGESGRNRS